MNVDNFSEREKHLYKQIVFILKDFSPPLSAESCILLTDAIMKAVIASESDFVANEDTTTKTLAEGNAFFATLEQLAREQSTRTYVVR